MASLAQIAVDLIANTASFTREFRKAAVKASENMSAIRKNVRAMRRSIDRATRSVHGLVAAYVGIQGLRMLGREVYENTVLWQGMQYTLQAGGLTAREVDRQLEFLTQTSYKLGVSVKDMGSSFSRFVLTGRTAGMTLKTIDADYKSVVEAMRVFHLSGQQATRSWLALSEVMSIGTLKSRQFTQQLGRDWPGIGALIAKAMYPGEHSMKRFEEAMKGGAISSTKFMNAFQDLMQTPAMQGALNESITSIQSAVGRLSTSVTMFFNEAQNPRALENMTAALNDLSATLSDDKTKRGFDDFVSGLTRLIDWTIKATAKIGTLTTEVAEHFAKTAYGNADPLGHMKDKLADINKELKQAAAYKAHPALSILGGASGINQTGIYTDAQISQLKQQRSVLQQQIAAYEKNQATIARLNHQAHESARKAQEARNKSIQTVSVGVNELPVPVDYGAKDARQWKRAIDQMNAADSTLHQLQRTYEKAQHQFKRLGESMGRALQSTLTDYFMGIDRSFGDMLRRMAIQAAESVVFSRLAAIGGPVGQAFSFLGFAQHRAMGGDVAPNVPYWVGENGPELIVPRGSGTVVPNDQLGGGLTLIQHNHFDAMLESMDARIMAATPHIAAATRASLEQSRRRPNIA